MDRNGREREARTKSVLVLKMLERIIVWRCDDELLVDRAGRNWFLCVWILCADLLLCGALFRFVLRFGPVRSCQVSSGWFVRFETGTCRYLTMVRMMRRLMFRVLIQFALLFCERIFRDDVSL